MILVLILAAVAAKLLLVIALYCTVEAAKRYFKRRKPSRPEIA